MADGGNAVDAAVASALVSCVTEPTLTGLGGSGFATVSWADPAEQVVLDFFAAVPGKERTVETSGGPVPVDVLFGTTTQTFHVGPQSCAVPGFVRGIFLMHERWGSLPRHRVFEPAIEAARGGVPLTDQQAFCHRILTNILTRTELSREVFTPAGRMMQEGELHVQGDLAGTLEFLVDHGADAFYVGDVGRAIVDWSDAHGGLLSAADLREYRVREVFPVASDYRSFRIIAPPAPSSGGSLIAYHLRLVERELGGRRIDLDTSEGARLFIASMMATNAMRGGEFERWLYGGGLDRWLMSDDSVLLGRQRIHEVLERAPTGTPSVHGSGSTPGPGSSLGNTTHISVMDAAGNAVAITTSTGCGSGEFVGSTGIHLNNMMGEEDLLPVEHRLSPGERLTSMMSPTIVTEGDRPRLATGSAGSSRIRSAVTQSILRALEPAREGRARPIQQVLREAVEAGRMHAEGDAVHVEPGVTADALAALAADGWDVTQWPEPNLYFGGVNMAALSRDGDLAAAGDPRRGGAAWLAVGSEAREAP